MVRTSLEWIDVGLVFWLRGSRLGLGVGRGRGRMRFRSGILMSVSGFWFERLSVWIDSLGCISLGSEVK